MRIRTTVKAGGMRMGNHNEAIGLKLKSRVRAGGTALNHNEATGLKLKSRVRAGGLAFNHNERPAPLNGLPVSTHVKAGGRMGRNPATGE